MNEHPPVSVAIIILLNSQPLWSPMPFILPWKTTLRRRQLFQAVWYLKCRALTQEQYLDDTEMEDQVQCAWCYHVYNAPFQGRHLAF